MSEPRSAPGAPGIAGRWTSSAKSGVGTAFGPSSKVWFTISHGILNEIYYPRVDWACTRDLGLIVTAGPEYVSEEKRRTSSSVTYLAPGVPAYHLENTCLDGRYRIEKDIIADPERDVVLQRTRFVPLVGALADYRLYVVLAPHLGNRGAGNSAWLDAYKGVPVLLADREEQGALALLCSAPWAERTVSYAGEQDAWHDLMAHGRLTVTYERAESGNVELVGAIDLSACGGEFTLALGFATHAYGAAHHARSSLQAGFEPALRRYIAEWQTWQRSLLNLVEVNTERSLYHISTAVLRSHADKQFAGGLIASLSIPWGASKGDDDLGGYHLVWTRDLVETVGGLIAAGANESVVNVLRFLQTTQEADGSWVQNMWLDGTPYWSNVQLDETGFPILLTAQAWREGVLDRADLAGFWPMVRRAAAFLVRTGPVTPQDRWEEDGGYSPFTLAVVVAALLAAADLADLAAEAEIARYLRETADIWNSNIERWTYVRGTAIARDVGVDGYYVRIAPADPEEGIQPADTILIKNRPSDRATWAAGAIVSPDALALVRFGLRAPDDPRIVNTVRVVDALLKVETPAGSVWRRYNEDGYGEHPDGAPYDGTGQGRLWPLLVGERAHYELAAGRLERAAELLRTMNSCANEGGMLPEQIWDGPDVPARELVFGRPTGSAMPLVWAHAEYVKLCRSLREQRVFDLPPPAIQRRMEQHNGEGLSFWRFSHRIRTVTAGTDLRIEVLAAAAVRWSSDGWATEALSATSDTGLGVYTVDLPTAVLVPGAQIVWTFHWTAADRWEGSDFSAEVVGDSPSV